MSNENFSSVLDNPVEEDCSCLLVVRVVESSIYFLNWLNTFEHEITDISRYSLLQP